ncbi:hypothetical protein BS17DRAFT_46657 [Gyrodon lividus]|nr:hypothetical protein BS17DRAFT_46657 [Gyrodon lividus]
MDLRQATTRRVVDTAHVGYHSCKQDPEVVRLAAIYSRWMSLALPAYTFECITRWGLRATSILFVDGCNPSRRRQFQSQGLLFAVPTQIIIAIAPISVIPNYLLVWGPALIRLGFIGAPIATAISYNLIAILAVVCFVERTAWHLLSFQAFTSLGYLGVLGLGSIVCKPWRF